MHGLQSFCVSANDAKLDNTDAAYQVVKNAFDSDNQSIPWEISVFGRNISIMCATVPTSDSFTAKVFLRF